MSLPRIQSNETVTKPAEAEKTFPDVFLTQILIQGRPGEKLKAHVRYVPYNYDTGEADTERSEHVNISDIEKLAEKKAVDGKTELATAMTELCKAVEDIIVNGQ